MQAPFHVNPGIFCVVLAEQMQTAQQQQQQSALSCAPGPAVEPDACRMQQDHRLLLELHSQPYLASSPTSMPPAVSAAAAAAAGTRTQQQQQQPQDLPLSLRAAGAWCS